VVAAQGQRTALGSEKIAHTEAVTLAKLTPAERAEYIAIRQGRLAVDGTLLDKAPEPPTPRAPPKPPRREWFGWAVLAILIFGTGGISGILTAGPKTPDLAASMNTELLAERDALYDALITAHTTCLTAHFSDRDDRKIFASIPYPGDVEHTADKTAEADYGHSK
jgi:hypothetical protein